LENMVFEGKSVVDVNAKIAGRGCGGVDFRDTLNFEDDVVCTGLVVRVENPDDCFLWREREVPKREPLRYSVQDDLDVSELGSSSC
jgi:hypothetical protein